MLLARRYTVLLYIMQSALWLDARQMSRLAKSNAPWSAVSVGRITPTDRYRQTALRIVVFWWSLTYHEADQAYM